MSSEEPWNRRNHPGGNYLIPAGIMIGLGIGFLTDHLALMLLIGLGCGFFLAAFAGRATSTGAPEALVSDSRSSTEDACCNTRKGFPCFCSGFRGSFVFIGIFFILMGFAITWAPSYFWKYVAPAFLILFGIWFVYREYSRNK